MVNVSTLKYKLWPYNEVDLGRGAYGIVYKATEGGTGRNVALKVSRVSRRVKRPALQHEVRILRLLEGHPAIPAVYGYGHLEHFEYIAMELLGSSIAEKQEDGAALMVKTVIRFVDQALAALQHMHLFGIVHRDIKPENFLCVLDDPSRIKLIDFGISRPFSHDTPGRPKYDPLEDRRHIIGSLYWASLNSHNGEDLAPRDDVESLALIAIFFLRGNLPWKPRPREESRIRSQEVVRIMKSECSGAVLLDKFPSEFNNLLTHSRSLAYTQLPDYGALRAGFVGLGSRMGYSLVDGPLDWTPCYPQAAILTVGDPAVSITDEDDDGEDGDEDGDDLGEDSYFAWDIDIWDRQGERDKELTLPTELEAELDINMPSIEEVVGST